MRLFVTGQCLLLVPGAGSEATLPQLCALGLIGDAAVELHNTPGIQFAGLLARLGLEHSRTQVDASHKKASRNRKPDSPPGPKERCKFAEHEHNFSTRFYHTRPNLA